MIIFHSLTFKQTKNNILNKPILILTCYLATNMVIIQEKLTLNKSNGNLI